MHNAHKCTMYTYKCMVTVLILMVAQFSIIHVGVGNVIIQLTISYCNLQLLQAIASINLPFQLVCIRIYNVDISCCIDFGQLNLATNRARGVGGTNSKITNILLSNYQRSFSK